MTKFYFIQRSWPSYYPVLCVTAKNHSICWRKNNGRRQKRIFFYILLAPLRIRGDRLWSNYSAPPPINKYLGGGGHTQLFDLRMFIMIFLASNDLMFYRLLRKCFARNIFADFLKTGFLDFLIFLNRRRLKFVEVILRKVKDLLVFLQNMWVFF